MGRDLIGRYRQRLHGVLSCYDRIVVTGTLPQVCYAEGMTAFLKARGVRIFDYPRLPSRCAIRSGVALSCYRRRETDPGGDMNLTHPFRWFLHGGGTDAEGGGSDGVEVLRKHGAGIRELARVTGHSRNTIRRHLREGEAAGPRRPGPRRAEKLDAFKGYIVERLSAAAPERIPAAVLFREIQARGYQGGETQVKQFVRGLMPAPVVDPVVRFETDPGQQMQADWATVGRGAHRLSVFIATLGWSRASYVEFCNDQRVETLIRCHENAFLGLGGVPREVLYDNMKTVVLERNTYGRGVHRFHAGFLDYAKHAGFLPRLCQPYRARTKGKVERFVRYLKGSFWVPFVASMRQLGLEPDKRSANAAVSRWLREVANARVHATTGEIPAERLVLERTRLQALPAVYGGRSARLAGTPGVRRPVLGYQHPLAIYDALLAEAAA